MQSFLQTIAREYARRYSDLSRFCFVFPGRRSGTFFIKELAKSIGRRTMIAPQTITISDFTLSLCGKVADNRIDLIFILYKCYLSLLGYKEEDSPADAHSFDAFRTWGETVLSDFNDIDTHLADPDALFKNLRDFNEISADYLTEEQREVMETYFNIRAPEEYARRFWKTFSYTAEREDRNETEVKERFIYLWQMLAPLYHEFNRRLSAEGLTYAGQAARQALECLQKEGAEGIEPLKMVFVGFNVLTTVEWRIFRELQRLTTVIEGRKEPLADFIWDLTGPVMENECNSASRFVRKGVEHFPKPEWLSLADCEADSLPPRLKVISSPSNVMQAKIVGREVERLHAELTQQMFDDARVAVVMPDEGLLMPMIHSLPDTMVEEADREDRSRKMRRRSIGVNLTMGLPLRHTPVVSFVALLRRLQTRLRPDTGSTVFFHEDVAALLAHPFTHILLGSRRVMAVSGEVKRRKMRYIPSDFLARGSEEQQLLFGALPQDAGVDGVLDYIDALLRAVDRLQRAKVTVEVEETDESGEVTMESLSHTHIETYRRALARLRNACHMRGVTPAMHTLFTLADRLIGGEKVTFEGDPIRGLQIMGLLETRSLDFDHLIIPSMNERIFPRRMRTRTFIPDTLRTAYGLPTVYSQESIYAYYFYRLICRAKSVTMIYDARTAALHSGDPSRFILQLKHLYARDDIEMLSTRFRLPQTEEESIVIPKENHVKEALKEYLRPQGRKLSASSLQKYLQCPVQFCLSYLNGVDVQEELVEFMSAIDLGNVVHDVMMHLYLEPDGCKRLLSRPQPVRRRPSEGEIEVQVLRSINTEYLRLTEEDALTPLTGEALIQFNSIKMLVQRLVDLDFSYPSLLLLGVEIPRDISVPLPTGEKVNFTMKIDRLDRVTDLSGSERYRIVDYKTGSVTVEAASVADIFSCGKKQKYFFQLMLYACLCHHDKSLRKIAEFSPVIYDANAGAEVLPVLEKNVTVHSDRMPYTDPEGNETPDIQTDFTDLLKERLMELFDFEQPFEQTDDAANCLYCKFKSICRR